MTSLGIYSQKGSFGGVQKLFSVKPSVVTSGVTAFDGGAQQLVQFLPPRWNPSSIIDMSSITLEQDYPETVNGVNGIFTVTVYKMRVDTREGSYTIQGGAYFSDSNHRFTVSAFSDLDGYVSTSSRSFQRVSPGAYQPAAGNIASATLIEAYNELPNNTALVGWYHDVTFHDPHIFDQIDFYSSGIRYYVCVEVPGTPNKFRVVASYSIANSGNPSLNSYIRLDLKTVRANIPPSTRWRIVTTNNAWNPADTVFGDYYSCQLSKLKFYLNATDSSNYTRSVDMQALVKTNALIARDAIIHRASEVYYGTNSFSFVHPTKSLYNEFNLLTCTAYGYHKPTLIDGTYLVSVCQATTLLPYSVAGIEDGEVLTPSGDSLYATFTLHVWDEGTRANYTVLANYNVGISLSLVPGNLSPTTTLNIGFILNTPIAATTLRMSGLLIK